MRRVARTKGKRRSLVQKLIFDRQRSSVHNGLGDNMDPERGEGGRVDIAVKSVQRCGDRRLGADALDG